ncbi:MAG: 5'-methylthioadenosine/S-adenosylhomocysteine nucleosidase [Pseudomonadota bacterium]
MALLVSALAGEIEGFDPLITGVGKVNAAITLTRYLAENPKTTAVVNLGSAGGVGLQPGAIVQVDTFWQWDMRCEGLDFKRGTTPFDQAPSHFHSSHEVEVAGVQVADCYTSDQFLDEPALLPEGPCVVEMEAFALAKVCYRFDIPFAAFKYVTDAADGAASEDWHDNLPGCAEALGQIAAQFT